MKMRSRIILILIFWIITYINFAQVPWPLIPFNEQHNLAGTVGEYRNTGRLHRGVDILGPIDVYAVENGTVSLIQYPGESKETIHIGSLRYVHVVSEVNVGDPVIAGQTLLGTMHPAANHVHLQDMDGNLLTAGLHPYVDNSPPQILAHSFRRNGHNLANATEKYLQTVTINSEDHTIIYNKVDIVVNAKDPGDGHTWAPYSLSYEIFNYNDESIDLNPVAFLTFEDIPRYYGGVECFGFGTTFSPANYNFILTSFPAEANPPTYDRYWNTGLRDGVTETWPDNNSLDASSISNTHYSDGIYRIELSVTDVDYANNPSHEISEDAHVLIDNFLPFIKKVAIYKDIGLSELGYIREWYWENGQYVFEPYNLQFDIDIYDNLWVKIFTSEPMNEVSLELNNYSETITEAENNENTEWMFEVESSYLTMDENQLIINGEDYAENSLIENPQQIPIRQANGTWQPTPNYGADERHTFYIGDPPPVDFSAVQIGSPDLTIQFIDQSSLAPISNWLWQVTIGPNGSSNEFIQGTNQNSQNPIIQFSHPGVYEIILTITVNGTNHSTPETEVSVEWLNSPYADFIYMINTNNKELITIDFQDQSDGIIDTWEWDFNDDGITDSYEQNPTWEFEENTTHYVSLTVSNDAGDNSSQQSFNPSELPYLSVFKYSLSYFIREFEIFAYGFDLSDPCYFEIDFGDGSSETYSGNIDYYIFEHNYSTIGDYTVIVSVTGTPVSGTVGEAYKVLEIEIYNYELNVQIYKSIQVMDPNYPNPSEDPPYINQPVTFSTSVSGAGNNYLWAIWKIKKIGDPNFLEIFLKDGWSVDELDLLYQFPSSGSYRVILGVDAGGATGHDEMDIEVHYADQYLDAVIGADWYNSTPQSQLTFQGTSQAYSGSGLLDEYVNPTNLRWKLFNPSGALIETRNNFGTGASFIEFFQTFYFGTLEGNYKLRLEAWNNTHNYEQNGYLDPIYADALPFYAFDEKVIIISSDYAYLNIVHPENTFYVELNAGTHDYTITISNPGNATMNWEALEALSSGGNNEFYLTITYPDPPEGVLSNNNEQQDIIVHFDENENFEPRDYMYVKIIGTYDNGTQVPGSPFNLYFNQWGTAGPAFQDVSSWFYSDDEFFGYSVAIDGNYAVVGAPNNCIYPSNIPAGSAFILNKNPLGIWGVVGRLENPNPVISDLFGVSVDICGEYVIVGAKEYIHIYKKPEISWPGLSSPIKSHHSDGNTSYGLSVAIWGDYAIVGAALNDDHGTNAGEAYIYYRNQSGTDSWGFVKELADCSQGDYFGTSVDIYNDIAVVGAHQSNDYSGFVKIYNRNGDISNDWKLEETLTLENNQYSYNARFGQTFAFLGNRLSIPYYDDFQSNYDEYLNWKENHYIRDENGNWNLDINGYPWNGGSDSSSDYEGNPFSSSTISFSPDSYKQYNHGYPFYNSYSGTYWWSASTSSSNGSAYTDLMYWDTDWWPPSSDDYFGRSIDASYNFTVVGAPGKNSDVGSIMFKRDTYYQSPCEAQIDLNLINFEKPSGNYIDVNAHIITLGGEDYPAIIRDGANITYEGNEIILKDGFVAENGSDFTARSINCDFGDKSDPDKTGTLKNELSQHNISPTAKRRISDEIDINVLSLVKSLSIEMKDYPWYNLDLYNGLSEYKFMDENHKVLLTVDNPNPEKYSIDLSHFNYDSLYLVFTIDEKSFRYKLDEKSDNIYTDINHEKQSYILNQK